MTLEHLLPTEQAVNTLPIVNVAATSPWNPDDYIDDCNVSILNSREDSGNGHGLIDVSLDDFVADTLYQQYQWIMFQ